MTLQNTGTAPLDLRSLTIAGANAAEFALAADGCSGSLLQPGDICTLNLRFTPAAVGTRSASLIVLDDAADSPQSISLVGTGIEPGMSLSAGQIDFGGQRVGTASGEQSVTVSNSGTAPFTVRSSRVSAARTPLTSP